MKIITWNCNGALRNKTDLLDVHDADLLVIQECENPAESTSDYRDWAKNYIWTGDGKSRGIGIFPRKNNAVRSLKWDGIFNLSGLDSKSHSLSWKTSELKSFVPFILNERYTILACWTKGRPDQVFGYMGQFWKYLQIHRKNLSKSKTIILGDFNSNSIWDKSDRWWNHTSTVNELAEIGIQSVYHHQKKEKQGHETIPTFFHHRKTEKPYHIDYIFASNDIVTSSRVEIGSADKWLVSSDHMPIILSLDFY